MIDDDDDDDVRDDNIYLYRQVLKEALECSIHEATGML